jgi:branched-chain amino acid transport system permease protein
MTINYKNIGLFFLVACLILGTGFVQSWNTALFILNMGLVSAIMALGVNLQWGFAGLFNVGIMGFVALGGLAAVLISMPPTTEAWAAGGPHVILGLILGAATVTGAILAANTDGSRTRQNLNNHRHFDRRLFHLSRGL